MLDRLSWLVLHFAGIFTGMVRALGAKFDTAALMPIDFITKTRIHRHERKLQRKTRAREHRFIKTPFSPKVSVLYAGLRIDVNSNSVAVVDSN
jgi:hypothetical protein